MRPAAFMRLMALTAALGVGCASQLTDSDGGDDADTDGSGSGGSGGSAGDGVGSTGAGASSSSSSGGSEGGGSASGGASASSTGAGGSQDCPADQHFCGGVCTGNTPQTGCFKSVACTACVAPAMGTSTCTATGDCDFTCGSGYMKSGSSCVCANECCTNADCSGDDTCVSGSCEPPAPTCDQALCLVTCFPGVGICVGSMCVCA